jgi:hypothetical protein
MKNIYLVSIEKTVNVIEERVVYAYTIEQAKEMITEDPYCGNFSDQYIYEDVEVIGINGVRHLGVKEEEYAV